MSSLPWAARLYLIAMWFAAASAIGMVIATHSADILAQAPLLLLWVGMFCLSDHFEVAFEAGDGNPTRMTVTDAVMVFLLAVAGASGMLVVALGTLIVDTAHRRDWFRVLFNVALRSIAFGLIWIVYGLMAKPGGLPFSGWYGLVIFAVIATIDYIAGVFFVSTILALASQQPLMRVYRESYRRVSWVYLVTTPAGAVLAMLWKIDPWMSVLGVVPLVMAQRSYKALSAWQAENRRNKALALESQQLASKLERLQDTATAMMASIEPLPLLETVSSRLAALMGASASWVVLLDMATLRVVVANGISADMSRNAQAYLAQLQSHTVYLLDADEIAGMQLSNDTGWQALAIIPLMLEQRVLGAICLASAQPIVLAEDNRRVLVAFAGQAALAMERARLFAELRDKQGELIRSSKLAALGTFSAGIAHEFNNLLAGILGHAELGLMSDDLGAKDESLNVAVRASLRGKSITRGLLTFARRNDPQRELGQIRDVIEDTLLLVERELGKLNIRIERCFELVPPTICDLGQISQVLLNLITNARDAMAELGGGTITIGLRQRGDQIELAVSDTGSGIPPDLLDQVFQPFVTTKGALGGSTTPGTGLGLAISYGIVESHGGTISATSQLGCGTTMTVRLPIRSALDAGLDLEFDTQSLMPMRILVVDDEQSIAVSLGRLLAERGHEISTAGDGNTALRLYRQQPFDLVISDVIMPRMGGATLVERLRSYDPNARVLVMTGQPTAPQAEQMLQLGAVGVIAKPFEIDQLLAAIARSICGRAVAV